MMSMILVYAIVFANGVLSQDNSYGGNNHADCSSNLFVMEKLSQCRTEFTDFMTYGEEHFVFQGSTLRNHMESVCRNRERTLTCVERIGDVCPQQKEFLENRTETIYDRLCNGNMFTSWYIDAVTDTYSNGSYQRCIQKAKEMTMILPGTLVPGSSFIINAATFLLASYSFECLVHSLANTNIEEAYPEYNSGVRSQDVFMIFYSMKACNPLWIRNIPSEEVFSLIKTFVASSPNLRRVLLGVLGFKESRK